MRIVRRRRETDTAAAKIFSNGALIRYFYDEAAVPDPPRGKERKGRYTYRAYRILRRHMLISSAFKHRCQVLS